LIQAGAAVNHRNKFKRTALMYAARRGSVHHVRELLNAGATPSFRNDDGASALMLASAQGHADIAALLAPLDGEGIERLPLYAAAAVGFIELIKNRTLGEGELLRTNQCGFTALELSLTFKRLAAFEFLAPYYEKYPQIISNCFSIACNEKSLDLLHAALSLKPDPERTDETGVNALMIAATRNFADGIEPLVRYGFRIDKEDENGNSAIELAQREKSWDALRALYRMRT
jgi:ankyrin repeat protein